MEQITLNLIPGGIPQICNVSQYDDGRTIRLHLKNGSLDYTLSGTETISLSVSKSDRTTYVCTVTNTSSSYVDITTVPEMCNVSGESECELTISSGNTVLGTGNFRMMVDPDAFDGDLKVKSVSGPIATFDTDLAEDLIKLDVDLEPIQDLHGYDGAWPAGGGKNIACLSADTLDNSQRIVINYLDENNVNFTIDGTYARCMYKIKAKAGSTVTVSFKAQGVEGAYNRVNFNPENSYSNYQPWGSHNINSYDALATYTKTFTLDTDDFYIGFYWTASSDTGAPIVRDFQVEVGSTATSFAPYENICPISGHNSAQLFRTGKNLLDTRQESIPQYADGPGVYANVTYTPNNDGSITINGTSTGASVLFFDPVTLNPLTSYPFPTWKYTNNRYTFSVTDEWGLVTGDAYIQATVKKIKDDSIVSRQRLTASVLTRSFTVREDEYIADAFVRLSSGASAQNVNIKIQLELGSTATNYEPYESDPTPVTVQFGQTIYKGKVIYESDLIEITHVCETYDGSSDEQWVMTSSQSERCAFRIYFQNNKKPTAKATDEMLSSTIPLHTTSETTSIDNDIITCCSTTYLHKIFYIFTPPSKISTVEELRAFLSNEPETVMYPLDEHIFLKISDLFISDNEPYLSRQSGGSVEVLDREIDSLVGGTIGWNQISALTKAASESYGITTEISNGLLTITGTPTQSSGQWRLMLDTRFSAIPTGHKLLLCGNTEHFWFRVQGADTTKTTKTQKEIMLEASSTTVADIVIMMANMDTSVAVNESVYLQLFDLTVMFGSVIADHIYALEQATAGAGIVWFREHFPKNYYPYNAGQLISVKTSKHVTTGKNLLSSHLYKGVGYNPNVGTVITFTDSSKQFVDNGDGTFSVSTNSNWETFDLVFKLIKNTTCYRKVLFTTTNMLAVSEVYLDSNLEVIWKNSNTAISQLKDSVITPPEGAAYYVMVFSNRATADPTTLTVTEPQIELGSTATDYTPYVSYEYPLDPNLELRGIPKLDGNKMYYDGDTYESSGSVTRKYGIIDLGTMTWSATPITNAGNRFYSGNLYNAKKPLVTSIIPNMICSKYEAKLVSAYNQAVNGITIYTNGAIQVYDVNMSSLTAAQFKTAMSGVYLVYELDTPTTESAASFENPQKIDPNGIEMYEDTRDIPLAVGHETKYLLNPDKPTIVTALVGTNNVYSDAGDVDVEYYTTLDDGGDGE